jgi:uncharacterized membrane protein YkoI
MTIRHLLPAALLSALLLSVSPFLPAQQTQVAAAEKKDKDEKKQKESKDEKDSEKSSKDDVKAFGQARVSITDAIASALKQSGGTVMGAGFTAEKGKSVYKVKTYQNNSVWEGLVDAQSGEMIGAGKTVPESELDGEDKAELAGISSVTLTLAQAVATAEKQSGGKAIKAELEEVKGKILYEIRIAKSGSLQEMLIDPRSGDILK